MGAALIEASTTSIGWFLFLSHRTVPSRVDTWAIPAAFANAAASYLSTPDALAAKVDKDQLVPVGPVRAPDDADDFPLRVQWAKGTRTLPG